MTEAVAAKLQHHAPLVHKRTEYVVPVVRAVPFEDYLALEAQDPATDKVVTLLISRHQWEVAAERGKKHNVTYQNAVTISGWKAFVLRMLGFKFI